MLTVYIALASPGAVLSPCPKMVCAVMVLSWVIWPTHNSVVCLGYMQYIHRYLDIFKSLQKHFINARFKPLIHNHTSIMTLLVLATLVCILTLVDSIGTILILHEK